MGKLQNRTAIITGGANGIGKSTAETFLAAGAKVAIWDVDEQAASSLLAEWKKREYEVLFQCVDITRLRVVIEAAAKVASTWGSIDILINNAGITRDASLKKMSAEQWHKVIDVNLTGVFNCTKAVSPYMVEQSYGRIVNTSSIVGIYGNFGQSNYVAAKSGVIGLTKVWARELGRKGITVNAVSPGFIQTEMINTVPEKVIDGLKARTPVGRLGSPDDIAQAYLFLASEEASFITGANLSVDGGLVI